MMRVTQKGTPLGTRSGNAMPLYEKQNAPSRGTLPASNASASKAFNKAPLTPRISGSVASVVQSPLARREARQDGNVSPNGSRKEGFPTPVTAFLSHNITPRSSSRKTRVDSANSTPTRTPTGTPTPDALRFAHESSTAGLNIVAFEYSSLKRPAASLNPTTHEPTNRNDQPQCELEKRFFYASDAKVAIQQPKQQLVGPEKTPSFVYANGNSIPATLKPSRSVVGSVMGSAVSEDHNQPKFFHANPTPGSSLELVQPSTSIAASAIYPQFKVPGFVASSTGGALSPLQRGTSPPKVREDNPASTFRHASPLPSSELTPAHDVAQSRERGQQTPRRASGHEKSASTGALDISPPSQWAPSHASRALIPSLSTGTFTSGSVNSPEIYSSELGGVGPVTSDISAPTKTGYSIERIDELAANARRERKVLDLEITNSSLAAINRTLEREMRKQAGELRRYRRLSRSGRLSIITTASIRTSLGTGSHLDETGGMLLSNLVEESDGDDQASDGESTDDGSLSPGAIVENDARHRMKDEMRLQLDLSKHQQLLTDSQNINQSLKRCLDWTEELIREGKRALEYSVGVNDIRFGGRVLPPDELDDNEHSLLFGVAQNRIAAIDDTVPLAGRSRTGGLESDSILEHSEERQ